MISPELAELLKRAVALSNPAGLHPFDEQRFKEFFDACAAAGVEMTGAVIDSNWPQNTIAGLGGDPAHSDKVQDGAYRVLDEWKKRKS
jgi:hypothetical protein